MDLTSSSCPLGFRASQTIHTILSRRPQRDNHAPLSSKALGLLFRHFRQREETLLAVAQVSTMDSGLYIVVYVCWNDHVIMSFFFL
jgi:hypothetical protein